MRVPVFERQQRSQPPPPEPAAERPKVSVVKARNPRPRR